MRITLIGTYPPRECGIGTFTQNLANAIAPNRKGKELNLQIVAINSTDEKVLYPEQVKYVVQEDKREDYLKVAKNLNEDGTNICILQHEFGIFGGDAGVYILSLVNALKMPLIITLHTILRHPDFMERSILEALGKKAQKVVVMSKLGAEFLYDIYRIPTDKVKIIEHGVPNGDKPALDDPLMASTNKILFTFGLLGRNKGIETVIHALPKVVAKHPNVTYMVLGTTHPNILKIQGEKYRDHLKQLVIDNNLEKNVFFFKKFVPENALFEYLSAIDIYLTPYVNEAQITSGTLSYAVGAGAAVVSTPYWHAKELLADGRGRLFDFKDSEQLADILIDLLDHPDKLAELKKRAYEYGKRFRWRLIGKRYLGLMNEVMDDFQKAQPLDISIIDLSSLPPLQFDHLKRLTDDTGIVQHAKFGIPNYKEGYCLDDNARALLAALMSYHIEGYKPALDLIPIYFSYLNYMQNTNGTFRNFLSFNRQFLDEEGSEDAFGRAIWAIGYLVKHAPNNAYCQLGEAMFLKASEHFEKLKYTRGMANTLIGMSYYLQRFPADYRTEELLEHMADQLITLYNKHKLGEWHWFEDYLSYDNGILPLALFHSSMITSDRKAKEIAEEATRFLDKITMPKGYLRPVGSNGWYVKDKEGAKFAQQATDVMAMVLLNHRAYLTTKKRGYLEKMFICYEWFIGNNDLHIPLYDHETHGCCDGLEATGVNRNQGAESTLAYLISNLTLKEAAISCPTIVKTKMKASRKKIVLQPTAK